MQEVKSPWSTVWYDPTGTIRTIIDKDPRYNYVLLVILGGVAQTLGAAAALNMGVKMSLKEIAVFALLVGPISGWLTLFIRGWLLTVVGHRLGGTATLMESRLCLAWSWAPIVFFLPLWGVKMILFKEETFQLTRPVLEQISVLKGLSGFLDIFDFIIYGWSIYVLIRMLAEVNRMSNIRAILSIIISGLLLAVPFLSLMYIISP